MSLIRVTVIIPAYNASGTIGKTLEALSKQCYREAFEVIVVDDGSMDHTENVVKHFTTVRYVRQENAGPASARNHGARLAQGEFLAFTDSDCIPHEDWLLLLMKSFGAKEVGIVAGSYGIANPSSLLAKCVYKEIVWRHAKLMPDHPNAFGSYNFCAKKKIFDQVGGFNVSYRNASGEDNDLSYKIVGSGFKIYFQRKALVDHYHPESVVKYLKEQYRHGYWRVKMYKDHPQMMRGDGYTYWKDIVEVPLAVLFILGSVLSALHYLRLNDLAIFFLLPFLLLEILSAMIMINSLFEGIFFGFVIFFRAFVRMLGFSTGILCFFR